jgi:hypothetical protein
VNRIEAYQKSQQRAKRPTASDRHSEALMNYWSLEKDFTAAVIRFNKDIEMSVLRARLLDRPIFKSIRDEQVKHCLAALCL